MGVYYQDRRANTRVFHCGLGGTPDTLEGSLELMGAVIL